MKLPTLSLLATLLSASVAIAQTSLIRNGNFQDGMRHWNVEQHSPAVADVVVSDSGPEGARAISIEVVDVSEEAWRISLIQSGFAVTAERRYRISFLARSEQQRWICAALAMHGPPYRSLAANASLEIGRAWTPVTLILRPSANEPNARFTITNLANKPGTIWITNISVIEE